MYNIYTHTLLDYFESKIVEGDLRSSICYVTWYTKPKWELFSFSIHQVFKEALMKLSFEKFYF